KFIKRSSRRVQFKEQKSILTNPTISTVFRTPDNEIVLVVLNPMNHRVNYSIYDPQNGISTLTLSENSIYTLIWK
ncbi:hypothetical protein B4U80_11543, partial [Leptotrombidium deliense]